MTFLDVILRLKRVIDILKLDVKARDNKERVEEVSSLVSLLERDYKDVEQELKDLKEWAAYDIGMHPEDFEDYWRHTRVNLYR